MARYLLDTNVLLRAASAASAQHLTAVAAVSALLARGDELVVAPQVLIEFWSVATRPLDVNGFGWPVELVENEVRRLIDQFPLLPDTPAIFAEWLHLVSQRRVAGKQVHDARVVALMHAHQITHLLTFNVGDFVGYGIIAVSPEEVVATAPPPAT